VNTPLNDNGDTSSKLEKIHSVYSGRDGFALHRRLEIRNDRRKLEETADRLTIVTHSHA